MYCTFQKVHYKRNKKPLLSDEFKEYEKNEIIGNSIPMFCTEDLESIICTESTDDTVDDNNNTLNEKTFIKLADFDIVCK